MGLRSGRLAAVVSTARIAAIACLALLPAACGRSDTMVGVEQAMSATGGPARLPPLKVAPPVGKATVLFLPFSGLPVNTADDIYRRIRARADKEGLALVLRLEEPATYRVRGYFVALGGDANSVVTFTYEIFDASGRRVHTFTGQELSPQADGDPWSGVEGPTNEHLAERAVQAIKAWVTRADP